MEKHINTKHNHNSVAKECSSKDTSEKVKDQREQTETNEEKGKDKNRQNAGEDKCPKCDKILTKNDNIKESACQYCIMMLQYG